MCLENISSIKKAGNIVSGEGYVVMLSLGKGKYESLFTYDSVFEVGVRNKSLFVPDRKAGINYPAGFHIFKTLDGAKSYRSYWNKTIRNDRGLKLSIIKVIYDDIVCEGVAVDECGYEAGKAVVARYRTILKEV